MKDILLQRDGGKQDYEAWYSYGRKQGFDVDDEKLLTPTFSVEPRFLFVHMVIHFSVMGMLYITVIFL